MPTDWQKLHDATQRSADIVDRMVRASGRSEWNATDRWVAEQVRLQILTERADSPRT